MCLESILDEERRRVLEGADRKKKPLLLFLAP
jgi:hypothetical protein